MQEGLLLIIPMPALHADVEVHLGFDTVHLLLIKKAGKFFKFTGLLFITYQSIYLSLPTSPSAISSYQISSAQFLMVCLLQIQSISALQQRWKNKYL